MKVKILKERPEHTWLELIRHALNRQQVIINVILDYNNPNQTIEWHKKQRPLAGRRATEVRKIRRKIVTPFCYLKAVKDRHVDSHNSSNCYN